MKLSFLLQNKDNWISKEGDTTGTVLSSRIRLARNIADTPFSGKSDFQQHKKTFHEIMQAAKKVSFFDSAYMYDLSIMDGIDRFFLMERHQISHEHACAKGVRGLIMSPDEGISMMINEEDHMRMQCIDAGLTLRDIWKTADALDSELGSMLPYAYDSRWGYLTACPTNVGTGMRASCLIHLPALVMSNEINTVLAGFSRIGITARGLYGEGTRVVGDLFQLSNASSLGKTEEEIIDSLERVVRSIVVQEKERRHDLLHLSRRAEIEDKIYRSYGILTHTRSIDFEESMHLFSLVRLGKSIPLNLPVKMPVINQLIIDVQPAHIQEMAGKKLPAYERDIVRADFIRKTLEKHRKRKRQ